MSARFGWAKGHGTENDFVLLPDPDGSVHGELDPALVAALCHRRRGIGADGVMRVVRSDAYDAPAAVAAAADGAEWFMDYRNADGSLAQMCGNGIRVLARWLAEERLVDTAAPLGIGTRDGTKQVTYGSDGSVTGTISVDMGVPEIRAGTWVEIDGRRLDAVHVDTGNPHAVAVVDDLASVGRWDTPPTYDHAVYPEGVNVELVQPAGWRHVRMRVHERGSGETRSCGTGVCAVAVAVADADGAGRPATYRVDVPGGRLEVTWREDGHMVLTGPAVVVARGEMSWSGR